MTIRWKHVGGGRREAKAQTTGEKLVILPNYGHFGNNIYSYQLYKFVGPEDNDWKLVKELKQLKKLLQWAEGAYGELRQHGA